MSQVEFPSLLENLLSRSEFHGPLRTFADRVGEILNDNKLPFFPGYTNHGIEHVNQVLKAEIDLIPRQVWEHSKSDSTPRLLDATDATVIIGATLLHDLAMHLRSDGFLQLVSKDTRFKPLPWFKENHEGYSADRPWPELWDDYQREARRFSDRALIDVIGKDEARAGWKFNVLKENHRDWHQNDFLIIGEFMRRHHARLAHEIAIYGFPGLPTSGDGAFPALGDEMDGGLQQMADLIGLTARSHWTDLRVCQEYLRKSPRYTKTPRPMGAAALYAMALLRVADYLQIDKRRAPAVLLQLRNPPSPVSVREWHKHRAVQLLGPADDPRAVSITVNQNIGLEIYLQLRELLAGLQSEMDHSTAVLDEVYGTRTDLGLNLLSLAKRRVISNLHDSEFLKQLPFVPERTGFSADPNLLALLVEPLYGRHPCVGVRELMQNAVDAVRELESWRTKHGKSIDELDLSKIDCDVLIEFIKRDNGSWFLRITDRGIGMTAGTIKNYFLRAGASFRQSAEWMKEFVGEDGKSHVLRAGRFGVGAFATFLLGPTFTLKTRHVTSGTGYSLTASEDSQLVEIKREDNLPIGTCLEINLSAPAIAGLCLGKAKKRSYSGQTDNTNYLTDWYCWEWPKVKRHVVNQGITKELAPRYTAPAHNDDSSPEWSKFQVEGDYTVFWTFDEYPSVVCNGIEIRDSDMEPEDNSLFDLYKQSQLNSPKLAVLDEHANFPLTIKRDNLMHHELPFAQELSRDLTLSFIAYALICGPSSQVGVAPSGSYDKRHPLNFDIASVRQTKGRFLPRGVLNWCSTKHSFIPVDPWLYPLLNIDKCLVYGRLLYDHYDNNFDSLSFSSVKISDVALLCWDAPLSEYYKGPTDLNQAIGRFLKQMHFDGITLLGNMETKSRIIASTDQFFDLDLPMRQSFSQLRHKWFELKSIGFGPALPLENLLVELETLEKNTRIRTLNKKSKPATRYRPPECLYIAEIHTEFANPKPKSLIAKVWDECLGANPIPFKPAARQALIERGKKHPELRRHIGKWEQMKRTCSKWTK